MGISAIACFRKLALLGLALFGVFSILATGGGDGGGEPAAFSARSAGIASKGIIRHGLVTAEELDADGRVVGTVGSAETGSDGRYSLTIDESYGGGPVLLTIRGKVGGGTEMVCDVATGCGGEDRPFGSTLPLDEGFAMTAIVPPLANGASISAQITPFTHMAARRALAAASLDADAVRDAISEVNQMVGVNILAVEPVDVTQPDLSAVDAESLAYAVFVAAAGELAFAGGDLASGLEQLAQSFEDGMLTDSDPVDPAVLLAALGGEASNLRWRHGEAADAFVLLDQIMDVIAANTTGDCNTSCRFNPEPSDSATLTAVERARALVAQVRTWLGSLKGLASPVDAFEANLRTAGEVLEANRLLLEDGLDLVLESVYSALAGGQLSLGTQTLTVYDWDGVTPLGTAQVTASDAGGLVLAMSADDIHGVAVDLTLASDLPAEQVLAGTTIILAGAELELSGTASNAQASVGLDQMLVTTSFETPIAVDPTAVNQPEPVLTALSLAGGLQAATATAAFDGNARLDFVTLANPPADIDVPALARLSLQEIELDGSFDDNAGNRFTASATLTVHNADQFDTLGTLSYRRREVMNLSRPHDEMHAANYVRDYFGEARFITFLGVDYATRWGGDTCFSWRVEGSIAFYSRCATGDVLGVTDYLIDLAGRGTPSKVLDVEYSYTSSEDLSWFSAEFEYPLPEAADNFAQISLGLDMNLALGGYPDASVVINANRTAYRGGDLRFTLSHDGQSLRVAVDKANGATPGEGTLTVTTPDGEQLVVTASEGDAAGELRVDGKVVATVETTTAGLILIRYNDGTFESL